jgi:hypothetical protein
MTIAVVIADALVDITSPVSSHAAVNATPKLLLERRS